MVNDLKLLHTSLLSVELSVQRRNINETKKVVSDVSGLLNHHNNHCNNGSLTSPSLASRSSRFASADC